MELVVRLRERGYRGVVSGAGPSVLVLLVHDHDADDVCRELPDGWHCHLLDVDRAVRGSSPPDGMPDTRRCCGV
jgi:homoserine kinase